MRYTVTTFTSFTQPLRWPAARLALCWLVWLTSTLPAQAGNICDTQASLINPQANPVAAQAPGIGGTGMLALKPGIGGTGMLAARPGVGGTGIDHGGVGGTGIVGVITGFASICVGGVEVHYDADTPMTDNGQPSQASVLAVGQMVVVNAAGTGDEVHARRVALLHVAIGPLHSVSPDTGEFHLMGQRAWAMDASSLKGLPPGQWVRVSGQRNAYGDIMATHVQAVPPQQQAQVLGVLSTHSEPFSVAGTAVSLAPALATATVPHGSEVMLRGTWTGQHLAVTSLTHEPTRSVLGAATQVVMEGFVRSFDGRSIDIDRRVMTLSPQTQISLAGVKNDAGAIAINQKVRITGHVDSEQRIHVERIETAHPHARGSAAATTSDRARQTTQDTEASQEARSAHGDDGESTSQSEKSTSSKTTSTEHATDSASSKSSESTAKSSTQGRSGESSSSRSSSKSGSSGKSSSSGKSGGESSKGK